MKIVRYGPAGAERPGQIDSNGCVRSLWPLLDDINVGVLSSDLQCLLGAIDPDKLPLVGGEPRLGMPIVGIRQVIAVAANYRAHAEERGNQVPVEPMIFNKSIGSLHGPFDPILLPPGSAQNDWEIEMGVLIGKTARRVSPDEAMACVGGYCVVNDVSERHWQHQRAGQFGKGKSFDTFTPIGPWLVTPDEISNPQALEMWLDLNSERRQNASTEQMVYSVATLISYISEFMTLEPGDLIATGTPAGVGAACNPPVFLEDGDRLVFGITGLGEQSHQVVRDASDTIQVGKSKSAVG